MLVNYLKERTDAGVVCHFMYLILSYREHGFCKHKRRLDHIPIIGLLSSYSKLLNSRQNLRDIIPEFFSDVFLILVQENDLLEGAEHIKFLLELKRWWLKAGEKILNVLKSTCCVHLIVTIWGYNSIKLLAVNWQRHFDVFDILASIVNEQVSDCLGMYMMILLF